MRSLITFCLFLGMVLCSYAQQQTRFQSVGSAGTANGQATNGTLTSSGSFGQTVSQGTGQANNTGFFVAVSDLAPSTQTSAIIFSGLASTQLTLRWTIGNGANRVVLAQAVNAVNATPVNGTTYAANAAFGLGAQLGVGNYVIYNGSDNTVTVTGLTPSAVYNFQVFEYNGTGLSTAYKTTTAAGNPASQTTLASPASVQTSALSFSTLANNGVTLSWTNGDGANRVIVAKQATPVNGIPASGQGYTANAAFGSGDQVGTGNYLVYNGSGNNVAITGLVSNTLYYFQSFEFNGVNATSNYLTNGTGNTAQQLTLTDPTVAAAALSITQNSFAASWSPVTGATSYSIDVSADGFATFAAGFNNASISGTSTTVTGLSSGTTYQYRVRVNNAAGASTNSNAVSALTIPATPVAAAATAITQTGVTASWNVVAGATNYFIDVATDAAFSSTLSSYSNLQVNANLLALASLTPGITYYYRVRSNNGTGSSPSSNVISQITIPPTPIFTSVTALGQISLQVNWGSATGATGYFFDLSTSSTFATFVTGFANLSVSNVTTYVVTGLSPNTTYYYQVRAANGAGISGNAIAQSSLTLPSTAVAAAATAITQTGFTANWNASSGGASNYFIDVATDAAFTTILTGYNNLSVSTNSIAVTGLTPGTTYYYQVRAANATGSSPSSNVISQITISPTPVFSAVTALGQTSLQANWGSATGATGYFFDLSTSSTFATFVTGFANLSVSNVTTYAVTGLSPNTTYYYQVRAANGAGISGNAIAQSSLTLPSTAVATAATAITQTGFTANWNASSGGASNYFIDVATDAAFTTILTGYNNLSVSTNSMAVTGLTPGTTYYYQVRAANATGSTPSSNAISQITIPPTPIFSAVTGLGQTSLQATWGVSKGASGYFLEVSTVSTFGTFVTGFANLSVSNVITYGVTGLGPNTTYYYRVRATNAGGTSSNSTTQSSLTLPATPVAIAATSISATGFTANWNASPGGAANYFLDVATDAGFSTILSAYNSVSVTGSSLAVMGLTVGTAYYYRVRSSNATGNSPSSNVITQVTIPLPPTGLTTSGIQSTGFVASWTAVAGADSYEVDVSKDVFATLLTGYNPYVVTRTSAVIAGLSPNTVYYYRVRAVNTGGKSAATEGIPTPTLDQSGISNSLTVGTPQVAGSVALTNGAVKASIQITGGFATSGVPITANFLHRKITEATFTSESVTSTSGTYEFAITSAMADELGVEFYFVGKDITGAKESAHGFTYISYDAVSSPTIPFAASPPFDGTAATYQMFSVPFAITDKSIASVFSALGAYDKTKWRLFHFQNGKYAENQDGLTNIDVGNSYWFNIKDKVDIKPGAGGVVQANQLTAYTLPLAQGWNQIGNPFPFTISWNAVKAANPSATINPLWLFGSTGYTKADGFKPWTGGFVWSEAAGNINIPVTTRCTACGRIAALETSLDLDTDSWRLPISLTLNDREQISSIGMNPNASLSKDKFDEITVPRFIEYLEMNTYHKEFFAPYFSADIVPTSDQGTWEFTLSSNQKEGKAALTWDQAAIQHNSAKLALYDFEAQALVDMKATNQYTLTWTEGRKLKIMYSKDGDILPEATLLGQAYPNPFNESVTIPVLLHQDQAVLELQIYDLLGRKITTISKEQVKSGILQFEWDGSSHQGNKIEAGLYLYQLYGDLGSLSPTKKMIKQ